MATAIKWQPDPKENITSGHIFTFAIHGGRPQDLSGDKLNAITAIPICIHMSVESCHDPTAELARNYFQITSSSETIRFIFPACVVYSFDE